MKQFFFHQAKARWFSILQQVSFESKQSLLHLLLISSFTIKLDGLSCTIVRCNSLLLTLQPFTKKVKYRVIESQKQVIMWLVENRRLKCKKGVKENVCTNYVYMCLHVHMSMSNLTRKKKLFYSTFTFLTVCWKPNIFPIDKSTGFPVGLKFSPT